MSCMKDVHRYLEHEISTGKLLELHNARDVVGCLANLIDEHRSASSAAQKRIDELEQWRRGAGPCKLCGEPTDSLAGNPDRWSIMLPFPGGDGKDAPHHIGCVLDKMYNTPPKEP